LARNQDNMSE